MLGVSTVRVLKRLDSERYVGDSSTMTVHDRWHEDCEDCLMDGLVKRGVAVAFEPDELNQAFLDGFEYCEHCIDKSDPEPPEWAKR